MVLERNNELIRRIGVFPFTPAEKLPATSWRKGENGHAWTACRDIGENSNAATVDAARGSVFVAATDRAVA
ncbi:hypothetical protein [Bradyrhizobium sp.]|uniref:hypothetical protein n=1 Tax=Bradyrhizobium sp. TaxID=376 RepID=UPI003C66C413